MSAEQSTAQWALTSFMERYRLQLAVLGAARNGTLAADWRANLTAEHGSGGGQADAEQLALHEVATSPTAEWEPYEAGGDWRRALDSWYQDSLHAREEYEAAQRHHWAAIGGSEVSEVPLLRRAPVDAADAQMQRDLLYVSYRAGLASGGDAVDWLAEWHDRALQWDGRLGQPVLAALADDPAPLVEAFQMLPDYWRHGVGRAP